MHPKLRFVSTLTPRSILFEAEKPFSKHWTSCAIARTNGTPTQQIIALNETQKFTKRQIHNTRVRIIHGSRTSSYPLRVRTLAVNGMIMTNLCTGVGYSGSRWCGEKFFKIFLTEKLKTSYSNVTFSGQKR